MEFSAEYLAGLFDGEGCIHIGKRKSGVWLPLYFLNVCMVMTQPELIYALAEQLDAHTVVHKHDIWKPGRRRAYSWSLDGSHAKNFLIGIYDYLNIKKEEARLAIIFQTNMEKFRYQARHMTSVELDELVKWRERVRLRVKECKNLSLYGATDWNADEFGEPPMPGHWYYDAEGQYRAKQELTIPGVCNEQVSAPKGKICSALTGNSERAAEMTAPNQRRQKIRLVE